MKSEAPRNSFRSSIGGYFAYLVNQYRASCASSLVIFESFPLSLCYKKNILFFHQKERAGERAARSAPCVASGRTRGIYPGINIFCARYIDERAACSALSVGIQAISESTVSVSSITIESGMRLMLVLIYESSSGFVLTICC